MQLRDVAVAKLPTIGDGCGAACSVTATGAIRAGAALETAVTNQYSGSASDHTTEAGVVAKAISEKLAQLRSR